MSSREDPIDRADRAVALKLATMGRELRAARIAAGLSQVAVGRRAHISHAQVGRLERGLVRSASVRTLAFIADAVGLELAIRAYPAGDPIRDAAQVRLLERFRHQIHPDLRWRTEVPLPLPGDRRAWDGMVYGQDWRAAVEAETHVADVQALTRRIALKQRDGGIESVIVVFADTRANRSGLEPARFALDDNFRVTGGVILAALREGRDPGGSGIVML